MRLRGAGVTLPAQASNVASVATSHTQGQPEEEGGEFISQDFDSDLRFPFWA
jgi:hypothetical protein